jgi:hypothetical protein
VGDGSTLKLRRGGYIATIGRHQRGADDHSSCRMMEVFTGKLRTSILDLSI